ncbi:ABC transporter ATP-binding protein [Candidatus Woesearchaeota archaeon]|jgi:ABC-type multidrug transport system fused ATPase/permease subunit|nr:ABC transporter ATP-binding protein [Candidatus Woesearchaeota archaeon]
MDKYLIFFKLLKSYYKLNKYPLLVYLLALIFDTLAKLLSIVSIIPLVDLLSNFGNNVENENMGIILKFKEIIEALNFDYTIETTIFIFIFATFISALTEIFFYGTSRINSYKIHYYITSIAVRKFYDNGLKSINSHPFGIIQNTFQKEIENITNGIFGVLNVFSSIVQAVFLLSLAFSLSYLMSTIAFLLMIAVFLILSKLNPLIVKLGSNTTMSGNELSSALFDPLLNAKQVISFGKIGWAHDNHASKFKKHAYDSVLSQITVFSIPVAYRSLGIVSVLIALYFSIIYGEDPALLVAGLIALVKITPIVSEIMSSIGQFGLALPSIYQFEKIFDNFESSVSVKKMKKYSGLNNFIKLSKITYSHDSIRKSIVNVNLTIEKGSYIAFVGHSGSGKTTCVDIILGLLKPSDGSVFIDNNMMSDIDSESFLNNVGYVQQIPFLFNGSVKENLLWSNPNATELDMWSALHDANIDKFIDSTKDKLDMQVGDRGVALSGGQKQRIVLAQALIRSPDILILDEATNSLDHESERLIIQSLENITHNVTIISITHNPLSVKNADKIFVFDNGSIIESGTYNELIEKRESFLNRKELI